MKMTRIGKIFFLIIGFIIGLLIGSCQSDQPYFELSWINENSSEKQPIQLKDYKGQWIIINHWATWCPPCIRELPEFQQFYEDKPHSTLQIIAISHDDPSSPNDVALVQTFTEKLNLTFPIVFATSQENQSGLGFKSGLPTTIIIAPDGDIMYDKAGVLDYQRLSELIDIDEEV